MHYQTDNAFIFTGDPHPQYHPNELCWGNDMIATESSGHPVLEAYSGFARYERHRELNPRRWIKREEAVGKAVFNYLHVLPEKRYVTCKLGDVFYTACQWWRGFYHFLVDVLPGLLYYAEELYPSYKLLVPLRHSVMVACLDILGIPDTHVILPKRGLTYRTSSLMVFSTFSIEGAIYRQNVFKMLRDHHEVSEDASYPSRVYLSRADKPNPKLAHAGPGRNRVISNLAEIEHLLGGLKFTEQALGAKTFKEKTEALQNAKVIVTPHGGQVMNCIFAKKLQRLIIMSPPSYSEVGGKIEDCDLHMAAMLRRFIPGLEVFIITTPITAEMDGSTRNHAQRGGPDSFHVDLAEVELHASVGLDPSPPDPRFAGVLSRRQLRP